jgi:hypothetical protein
MKSEPSEDRLNSLIREQREQRESLVNPQRILDGVRSRLSRPVRSPVWNRVFRWGSAMGATAALVFLLLWGLPSNRASAESLILEAKVVHSAPIDRLYLIESQLENSWSKRFPIFSFQRKAQLWTRGDRFFLETIGEHHRWAWGKDDQNRIWIAVNSKRGLIFDSTEIEETALTAADLYSMRMETLLDEIAKWCTLAQEEVEGKSGLVRIVATPRRNWPNMKFRSASVELDSKSKIAQKVTIKRVINNSVATVTYTLQETKTLSDTEYQLQGHLDSDAKIFGPDRPFMRNGLWKTILEKRGILKEGT